MENNTLLINEIFGPTWQGEGSSVGTLCYFIRTSNCNQACVFCDTFYTWGFTKDKIKNHLYAKDAVNPKDEIHPMSVDEICNKIYTLWNEDEPFHSPLIVISGGEPMLQSQKLIPVIDQLFDNVDRFEIETAGTIWDLELALHNKVHFNVSPKLSNSGNPLEVRYKPEVLKKFEMTDKAIFKFVVSQFSDFDEIIEIIEEIGIPRHKVYIMPEGIEKGKIEEKLKEIAPFVLKKKWNFSSRFHIQLFGDKRDEGFE